MMAATLKWSSKYDAEANAKRQLPRIVAQFFAVTRRAIARKSWPRNLHRVRLASKKLRYTLELFHSIYPAALDARLDELKKLQDWLGDANDAAASRKLLGVATLRRHAVLGEFLKQRADAQAAAFTHYWKETFDAKGQEKWWTDFLAE
ncbi:MAG: CHAD domain-containing protein [Candidatus Solibacter sp.]